MEKSIQVINQMQADKVIEKYAIGGAIGVIFYIEPVLTYDLDIFVLLPRAGQPLISLSGVYDYLKGKGYKSSREHIIIEGVPVQFIPAYNPLVEEAIDAAKEIPYQNTSARVLQLEHLMAIMLQTDRPKDRTRIAQILEEIEVDIKSLTSLLKRHGLVDKWQEFKRRFYDR